MDNDKKLFEELLKSDGINPAGISDSERLAFRELLDSEQKRTKRISWCITGAMWIFALAMIGLCVSERALAVLNIPFVAAGGALMLVLAITLIPLCLRFSKQLKASQKKAIRLERLVNGRRECKGLVMVGVKEGKRFIHWPNISIIAITAWMIISLAGAGIYYLLCRNWIFTAQPVFHIFSCVVLSLAFVISGIYRGLKAPLEELVEVKPEQYVRSRKIATAISASVIIIVAVGLYFLAVNPPLGPAIAQEFVEHIGPQVVNLADSSKIELAEGAKIVVRSQSKVRGFEYISGLINVEVAKDSKAFIVTTEFGEVKTLGTKFSIELINAVLQNTKENLEMLSVKVIEGTVQVSNDKGSTVISKNHTVNIERQKAPYDFTQDKNLPPRLIERIQSMVEAMETGDKNKYISNYNVEALYKLAKGEIKFAEHRYWFSGMSEENAQNFIKAFEKAESPEQMVEMMCGGISDEESGKIYVRSVILEPDGKHARAYCVSKNYGHTPQWTYFDGDWWQTDD